MKKYEKIIKKAVDILEKRLELTQYFDKEANMAFKEVYAIKGNDEIPEETLNTIKNAAYLSIQILKEQRELEEMLMDVDVKELPPEYKRLVELALE